MSSLRSRELTIGGGLRAGEEVRHYDHADAHQKSAANEDQEQTRPRIFRWLSVPVRLVTGRLVHISTPISELQSLWLHQSRLERRIAVLSGTVAPVTTAVTFVKGPPAGPFFEKTTGVGELVANVAAAPWAAPWAAAESVPSLWKAFWVRGTMKVRPRTLRPA